MHGRLVLSLIVCLLMTTFTALGSGARDEPSRLVALPANISVHPALSEMVTAMLEQSPTFRRQVQHLGRIAQLRTYIGLTDTAPRARTIRAQGRLSRYQYGGLKAVVEVPSLVDAPELIAHELEHVAEFAEGANFRALALQQPSEVWVTREGHFETKRAIAAGERVAREVPPLPRLRPTRSAAR